MALFGTQAWLDSFVEVLNNSESYAEAAKDWEGDFYFVATPGGPLTDELTMYCNLEHGKCLQAEMVTDPESHKPEYTVKGSYDNWKSVITRQLDPMQAIMTGKLSLKGNMVKIMKNLKAANELVNSLSLVATEFPE